MRGETRRQQRPMTCLTQKAGELARKPVVIGAMLLGASALWTGCATAPALKQGQQLEAAGKYEAAASTYQSLVRSGGTSAAQASRRLTAVQEKLATTRVTEGESALTEGRLSTAIALAGEAWALAPQLTAVQDLAATVTRSALGRAETQAQNGNPFEAANLILQVQKVFSNATAILESAARSSTRVNSLLQERISSAEARNLPGNALLYQFALAPLNPSDPNTREATQQRLKQWQTRMRVPVTLELSGRGSTAAMSQALSQAFTSMRFQSPLISPQLGARVPDGLHLEISELDFDIHQTQEPGFGTRAIETGTRRVKNPELAQTQEGLTRLEAEVMALGEKIDALNAQLVQLKTGGDRQVLATELQRVEREYHQKSQLYSELQERLTALPAEVTVANFQEVRYPLDLFRRTCLLNSRLKATSTRPDLPMKVDLPVTGKFELTCQVHPAYLQYGIPAGVLRFELTDNQLKERAQEDLASQVGSTVDRMINDFLVLERKTARELEKDGRKEEALEHWLRAAVGVPGEVPEEVKAALMARGFSGWDGLRVR